MQKEVQNGILSQEVNQIIIRYKQKLESMGIRVSKIILFGSYALGHPHEHSDIDLVVISNDFKKMDLWERLTLLGRARVKMRHPMEILGYTEEEYRQQKRGSFIGDEVKPKGIVIK